MAAAQNFVILNDLPKFKGNARPGEINFVEGINVRTFLRTLDNYYAQNEIDQDDQKIRILFAQICKTSGDAIDLVNSYAGREILYEDLKEEILQMYPNFTRTEFRLAAKEIIGLKVTSPSAFCGINRLENLSRAIIEAYLSHDHMGVIGVIPGAEINGAQPIVQIDALLQNFVMHLMLASQLPVEVYNKVSSITPYSSSTKFMARAVQAAEKEKLNKAEKEKTREKLEREVLYNMNVRENSNPNNPKQGKEQRSCHGCHKVGHLLKDCRAKLFCKFCKFSGHDTANCHNRKRANALYCTKCENLGHDVSTCYKNETCQTCKKPGHNSKQCYHKAKGDSGPSKQGQRNKGHVRVLEEQLENPECESPESDQGEE